MVINILKWNNIQSYGTSNVSFKTAEYQLRVEQNLSQCLFKKTKNDSEQNKNKALVVLKYVLFLSPKANLKW